eukprot:6382397-Pyramimonas_sp.AAC.1
MSVSSPAPLYRTRMPPAHVQHQMGSARVSKLTQGRARASVRIIGHARSAGLDADVFQALTPPTTRRRK